MMSDKRRFSRQRVGEVEPTLVLGTKSLTHAIARFRSTGVLNLTNKGLSELPASVCDFSIPLAPDGEEKWYEYSDPQRFDVSHNELAHLPDQLGDLLPLTYVDVSSNKLQTLPGTITQLTELRLLDISQNRFTELPAFLGLLPALASLSCAENELTKLPEEIGQAQPSLQVCNATGNKLTCMPPGLRSATSLLKLVLDSNRITSIPEDYFSNMSCLTELNLSKNSLNGPLPDCFGSLPALKLLTVRQNQITSLPDSICFCKDLIELNAGFNMLTTIPDALSACSSLRTLDLRANRLTELPASLATLSLHLMDLSNNSLQRLPLELGRMTSLRSMPLMGNPMKLIRPSLVVGPTSALLKALRARLPDPNDDTAGDQQASLSRSERKRQEASTRSGNVFGKDEAEMAAQAAQHLTLGSRDGELNLSGTKLKVLPEQVWQAASSCNRLDLSGLPLTTWDPARLALFTKLRALCMVGMGLQAWPLPPSPGALQQLQVLQLDRNPVREVGREAFAACPNLRELTLAGVPGMAAMQPGTLSPLSALTLLDLSQCRLPDFPPDLLSLTTLCCLRLRDNGLGSLPEGVTTLAALEELDLTNNNLTAVPPQVGRMAPVLKSLMLEGNILKTLRRSILERGTPAVLEYLRDRIPT